MDKMACLIVHGFGGCPDEIEYLREYLESNNIDVHTVLLAGHGKTKKELGRSTYKDWIESAEEAYINLQSKYSIVILIGFSMGGLLCTYLANIYTVEKIVFVNTPVYFWNIKVISKSIYTDIRNRKADNIRYYKKSVFKTPLRSGIHFLRILNKVKRMFCNITCPALILQCINDESVRYKSAEYIRSRIRKNAGVNYYEGGCHDVFNKGFDCRDDICRDILEFVTVKEDDI